jgi:hypothetical protein
MAELAGPLRVMKIAIQTARIAYPDYERESGTKWPDEHLDPAEAQLFAFAALRALDGAGFDIDGSRQSWCLLWYPCVAAGGRYGAGNRRRSSKRQPQSYLTKP